MKTPFIAVWLALAVAGVIVVDAQQPPQAPSTDRPFRIVKDDPALDDIIDSNAKLELVAEHIGLSEGPLWIQEGQSGYLLFTDVAANVIYKRTPAGQLSVFLENAGYTGNDVLNVGQQTISGGRVAIILIGPNGLALDPQGRVVIQHGDGGNLRPLPNRRPTGRAGTSADIQ